MQPAASRRAAPPRPPAPPLALLLRPLAARSCGATEAEAAVEVAIAGPEPAVSGAAARRAVVPAAAAHHPAVARCRTRRIRDTARRILAIPIITPFIHIAVHIVESPRIWTFLPYRVGFPSAVIPIPPHAVQTTPCIRARSPCSTGVFPFRLRRQARSTIQTCIHLADEFLAIFP